MQRRLLEQVRLCSLARSPLDSSPHAWVPLRSTHTRGASASTVLGPAPPQPRAARCAGALHFHWVYPSPARACGSPLLVSNAALPLQIEERKRLHALLMENMSSRTVRLPLGNAVRRRHRLSRAAASSSSGTLPGRELRLDHGGGRKHRPCSGSRWESVVVFDDHDNTESEGERCGCKQPAVSSQQQQRRSSGQCDRRRGGSHGASCSCSRWFCGAAAATASDGSV